MKAVLYAVSAGTAFLSGEYWFGEDDYSLRQRRPVSFISTLHQINGKQKEDADALAIRSVYAGRAFRRYLRNTEYYDPEKLYHAYQVSDLKEIFCSGLPMDLFCLFMRRRKITKLLSVNLNILPASAA